MTELHYDSAELAQGKDAAAIADAGGADEIMDQIGACHVIGEYLLRSFGQLCVDHGIQYYLNGGSLLGAVRHGGWIPWDDDIDLMMVRSEYEVFRDRSGLLPNDLRLSDPEFTHGHTSVVPRIIFTPSRVEFSDRFGVRAPERQHVVADIFILDEAPRAAWLFGPWYTGVRLLQLLLAMKATTTARVWRSDEELWLRVPLEGLLLISRVLPRRSLANVYRRMASLFSNGGSAGYVSLNSAGRHSRIIFPRRVFEAGAVQVEFCGINCPAPDTTRFLSDLYGADFMTPPSMKHRVSHRYTRFWADLRGLGGEGQAP